MKKLTLIMAVVKLLCLGGIAQADITIDTVAVGNTGNAGDTLAMSDDFTTGYGSVGYNYNIGKYEVTAGQYTAFLNAKAVTDTYSLYSVGMAVTNKEGSGITRAGAPGSYTYTVDSAWANSPVNYVNFWDACRFTNWLNNGQGNGDTETGAYTLTAAGIAGNTVTRNAGAKWAIPSENEWYKAAYHQPAALGGDIDNYWLYPTSSNTAPGRDMTDASGNNANTYGAPYPIIPGKATTDGGEFQSSDSPYGTFDQGGNVTEWSDTIKNNTRIMRGGSFIHGSDVLKASNRVNSVTMNETYYMGFRVVQIVPEPSSFIALGALVTPLLAFRRRRV